MSQIKDYKHEANRLKKLIALNVKKWRPRESMTCIYKFWVIIRNEFILCGSGDRINLREIMGKKISFYHKNPLLKCGWLQNITVFSEKKKKAKTEWCIKSDSSIREDSLYLKNWFYNKKLWTHKIWKDSTSPNMQELKRNWIKSISQKSSNWNRNK